MNLNQRNSNRANAKWLKNQACVCPECGQRGRHYISMPISLEDMLLGVQPEGFWTCDFYYDEIGRRKKD